LRNEIRLKETLNHMSGGGTPEHGNFLTTAAEGGARATTGPDAERRRSA
jgi:hypothetical protein